MRKIEKYINYIKTVLINKNIDNEITDWKSHQNLLELSNTTSEIYFTDSVKLGMDANELIYLIKINSDTVNDTVVSNIKNEIEERTKEIVDQLQAESSKEIFKSINLLFFVSSIHSRVTLKDAFSSKSVLQKVIPRLFMGESYAIRAHSPRYAAPSSMEIISRRRASFFSAPTSTALPPSNLIQKLSMSCPP